MKNMGKFDRKIRTVLGILFIVAAVVLELTVGKFWWIGLLGLIFIGTSAVSFCPCYVPFKISTDKKDKS